MKKTLLCLMFIASFSLVKSQSIGIVDNNGNDIKNSTITFTRTVDDNDPFQSFEVKNFASVVNNTSGTMVIGLKRYEVSVRANTGDAMCWGATCFGEKKAGTTPVWNVQDYATVIAGDTARGLAGFVVYHYPSGHAGVSTYRYEFYDTTNASINASVFITFDINVDTAAIRVLDTNNASLANDTITIDALVDTTDANQRIDLVNPVKIVNYSGDTNNLKIRRIEVNVPSTSSDAICYGDSCYGIQMAGNNPTWNIPNGILTGPTDTASGSQIFTITHYPNKKAGDALYRYEIYNDADTSVVSSFLVNFKTSISTGLEDIKKQFAFSVYPNPVQDITTIRFENELNYYNQQLEINSITGENIALMPIARGTKMMDLNLSDLASGIYLVNVQVGGKRIITKKLIVK